MVPRPFWSGWLIEPEIDGEIRIPCRSTSSMPVREPLDWVVKTPTLDTEPCDLCVRNANEPLGSDSRADGVCRRPPPPPDPYLSNSTMYSWESVARVIAHCTDLLPMARDSMPAPSGVMS